MALDAADQTVELAFLHGQIVPDDLQALAYAVGARFHTDQWGDATTVVLAQEIDILADGRFVLRLRLWPFHAFAIEFADLELRQSQRRDRRRSPGSVIIR
jgi:hypothetical protein